ncbi:HDOD domain-containing protein [Spongisporangium articulatum]|uniref:HDOD domain-containing protein n=1 Tax=Spongisporangium articulatum TaxID=3362603 RepID=A0ABW8ALQ5_9ACTN
MAPDGTTDGDVLFVDDASRELATLVPELVGRFEGRDLYIAGSGAQGLEQLQQHRFDAVVSNLRLDDMTGPQFLSVVQQRDPGIARLIVCGEASHGELASAAQVCHQMLAKPLDAQAAAVAIERVMAVRRKLDDPHLRQLMGAVDRLPSVPDVYQRIVDVASRPDFSMRDIAAVIAGDVASSVELLKLVNSAMFAVPRAVVTVDEAVSMLGVKSVSALVLAGSLFRAGALPAGLDAAQLQRAAVEASAVARAVAVADGWPAHDADQVSLAAMLRDVGILALAQGRPEAVADLDQTLTDPVERARQEHRAFGCTVPAASAYLLGMWDFPQTVVHAVGAQPLGADDDGSTPTEQILDYAYHRVLAGPDVRPPTPMLDPYRGLRWSTAAAGVLAEPAPVE